MRTSWSQATFAPGFSALYNLQLNAPVPHMEVTSGVDIKVWRVWWNHWTQFLRYYQSIVEQIRQYLAVRHWKWIKMPYWLPWPLSIVLILLMRSLSLIPRRSSIFRRVLTLWREWRMIWSLWNFPDCVNFHLLLLLGTDKGFILTSLDVPDVLDLSAFEHALDAYSCRHQVRKIRCSTTYHLFIVRTLQGIHE